MAGMSRHSRWGWDHNHLKPSFTIFHYDPLCNISNIHESSWRHPVLCQVLGRAAAAFPQRCPADASRLLSCGEPPIAAAGSAEGSAGEGLG